jgi:SPP1 gp7 family putative phage head morphogenesis protein
VQLSDVPGIDIGRVVEKAIRDVYDRRTKRGDLHADIWAANARALWQAAAKPLGVRAGYRTSTDDETATALRQNLYVFAAFKNHHNVADMVDMLTDANGNARSFDDFRRLALHINQDYNRSWLLAEYNAAMANAQAAVRWHDIERDKDALPMLRYVTAGDERVRRAHALLDGVTLPVDDPFWDEYFPPLSWNCRCDVQQVVGPMQRPTLLPDDREVPPVFRNNPGKTGKVFTLDHPYFTLLKPEQRARVQRGAARLIFDNYAPNQYLKTSEQAASVFKEARHMGDLLGHDPVTGGFVVLHRKHSASGLKDEAPVLRILKSRGAMLEMLDESKEPRYDVFWDGHFWDIKRMTQAANLKSRLHKIFQKARRAGRMKVLLHLDMDVTDAALMDGLNDMLRQNPSIRLVHLVWNNGRSMRLSPEDMKRKQWPKGQ